jgi:hypothetical protein
LIKWCALRGHPYNRIFAISNGTNKSPASAARHKREGLRAGIPDLFLPYPIADYSGLFIEMKRETRGTVSKAQKDEMDKLRDSGYAAVVCYGLNEAMIAMRQYIDDEGEGWHN